MAWLLLESDSGLLICPPGRPIFSHGAKPGGEGKAAAFEDIIQRLAKAFQAILYITKRASKSSAGKRRGNRSVVGGGHSL